MRSLLLLLAVVAIIAAGGLYLWRQPEPAPQWTSYSREAVEELEAGLEAERRYYVQEALDHFARALGHDPEFAMAKLKLMLSPIIEDTQRWSYAESLADVDTGTLTEREAFLIEYHLARYDGDRDRARNMLAAYLVDHPDDPFAIEANCNSLWDRERWDSAEACYEQLLEVEPNWVTAVNRLGYLAMGQGQLDKAEDRFLTYRYIAPDQANPHDSLGELLLVTGRYEAALESFEAALSIRPDFCASYANLVDLAFYSGELERLPGYVERVAQQTPCIEAFAASLACSAELYEHYWRGEWTELSTAPCLEKRLGPIWLGHLGALMAGDVPAARAFEQRFANSLSAEGQAPGESFLFLHLRGVRELAEGDQPAAIEQLRQADERLNYWGQRTGMFKLYNRLQLAAALESAGRRQDAKMLLRRVEAVNPSLAASYERGEIANPTDAHPASAAERPKSRRR